MRVTRQSSSSAVALVVTGILAAPGAGFGKDAFGKDAPRRWAAPHAMNGCEAFGPGYYKVDGSDTCVRVSGSVGVEATLSTGGSAFSQRPQRR